MNYGDRPLTAKISIQRSEEDIEREKFAKYVQELKDNNIRGEQYRQAISKWKKEHASG